MAKKLRSPYDLSQTAQSALDDLNIERAGEAGTMGDSAKIMKRVGRKRIETEEAASETSRDLGEVNKRLRSARRSRSSY